MRHIPRRTLLAALAGMAAAPALAGEDGTPDLWELPLEGMERVGPTLWVKPLAPGVWIACFTWKTADLGYVPANGLIVAGAGEGPTIVDTGLNRDHGDRLLALARRVAGRPAARAIATHFHDDRTGGGDAMRAAGVPVLAHPYSVGLAQAYGYPAPDPVRGLEKGPVVVGPLELFHPGAGHTRDNITAWHGESRTLFGGCFLRPTTARGLGNVADGDVAAYPATVQRLADRYPDRRFTVPGHGSMAGDVLAWTRQQAAVAVARTPR